MKIYLVGGAVRDQLLNLPIKEKDYVVVGASLEDMLKLGYRPVGKDFPVFLHPQTNAEYALARTERKTAKGYKGFEFHANPNVTLEEDLKRRDFTINAMAIDENGTIIDPYHGQEDLKNKLLRHVSEAFAEDPVRILRAARFAARFKDFTVHPETLKLMQKMVQDGEVDALVSERVWQEFYKAVNEDYPERFLEVLNQAQALEILFPAISKHFHTVLAALKNSRDADALTRFAAMFFSIDLADTQLFCEKIRVPLEFRDLAQLTSNYGSQYFALDLENPEQVLDFLEKTDAFRRPERFDKFQIACAANISDPAREKILKNALRVTKEVDIQSIIKRGFKGKEISDELRKKRLEVLFLFLRAR